MKAIVFERDCGGTTRFSTQISVISEASDLPNQVGNVFICGGAPDESKIALHWDTPDRMIVKYTRGQPVFRAETRYKYVAVIDEPHQRK